MNTHTIESHDHSPFSKDVFGFWIYIMSDCLLFASLFATFAVLHTKTFGGPALGQLVEVPYVLGETLFLLASSFTYGLAMLSVYRSRRNNAIFFLILTFLLGLGFVTMEINEFVHLYLAGHTWQSSAAMSSFFTLVGTHGLHVSIGLLWMLILIIKLFTERDIAVATSRKLTYLGLFWSFLDIVWIFVFTIVYLIGAVHVYA
ncbi:MAG: cytochrome o ubiquinol oxidase subunit III [Pseudomonadota bacterium]